MPSVLESDEPVARYSHIVPLVKTRMLEELSVCAMVELKQCAADWNMDNVMNVARSIIPLVWESLILNKKALHVAVPEE